MSPFRGPNPNDLDDLEDEYVDPDIIEPVFNPLMAGVVFQLGGGPAQLDDLEELFFPANENEEDSTDEEAAGADHSEEEGDEPELSASSESDIEYDPAEDGMNSNSTSEDEPVSAAFEAIEVVEAPAEAEARIDTWWNGYLATNQVENPASNVPDNLSDDLSSLDGPSDVEEHGKEAASANNSANLDSEPLPSRDSPAVPNASTSSSTQITNKGEEVDGNSLLNGELHKTDCSGAGCDTEKTPKGSTTGEDISAESSTDDEQSYSNPLVSAEEAVEGEAIRGDRIGNTIYSERHVLKILMRWIQELPKYSEQLPSNGDGTQTEEKFEKEVVIKLEREFKKDMELLWDMSSEPDVAKYLTEKNIFPLLRDSLPVCTCHRFLEIILGIFANILSDSDILKTFPEIDEEYQLIDVLISMSCTTTHVPVLLQCFAVLCRLAWYISNVKPVERWLSKSFTSAEFISAVTFMLKGSTNDILLKELVMLIFSLLETLIPGSENERKNHSVNEKYKAFATQSFVSALLEGLKELIKIQSGYPEEEDAVQLELEMMEDLQMPQHVQMAVRCGLGSLCYIQKIPEGQEAIRAEKLTVVTFLTSFFKIFHRVTDTAENDKALEYFIAALNLLAFCHTDLQVLQPEAVVYPIAAARRFIEDEELSRGLNIKRDDLKYSSETPTIITSIAILAHEYLGEMSDKFGKDAVKRAIDAKDGDSTNLFLGFIERVTNTYRLNHRNNTAAETEGGSTLEGG